MSKTITYKGKLAMGVQEKIHLSTNDGLKGYRIKAFDLVSATPGAGNSEFLGKIFITDQTGSFTSAVDFSDADLLAINFSKSVGNDGLGADSKVIIFDKETINQDIFVYITDATGNTVECNYYLELEQFKIDLVTSTYHTLKNIRSRTQV
jgi:hypothetical protein